MCCDALFDLYFINIISRSTTLMSASIKNKDVKIKLILPHIYLLGRQI